MRTLFLSVALFVWLPGVSPADEKHEWWSWRGPNGNGVAAEDQTPPTRWSATRNVLWKTRVPGRGHSSPVIVGNKLLLTTADESRQVQSVVCFDRAGGKLLWKRNVNTGGFPQRIHRRNTHATPTVASDGKRLFAAFFNNRRVQLAALDLQGKLLWTKSAGPFEPRRYRYGYAPSPLVSGGLVIVSAESEAGGYLAAFDCRSGREVWRTKRSAVINYSSPIVARTAGREQLVISGDKRIASYDPATGKPLWIKPAVCTVTCGTPVWDAKRIFVSGGYPERATLAMAADGSGTIVWRNDRVKCYEQSLLVHGGYVYAVDDGGVAYCFKAADGTPMWRRRLGGSVSASPVLAGGNIYTANERGTMFVFKANPRTFELVARNQLGSECFATPTICGNRIYLRIAERISGERREWLYCIGRR